MADNVIWEKQTDVTTTKGKIYPYQRPGKRGKKEPRTTTANPERLINPNPNLGVPWGTHQEPSQNSKGGFGW